MRDLLQFEAPLFLLGRLAESLLLKGYLKKFLGSRNAYIKRVAESNEWRNFIA
jgi:hypothetical protein